MEGENNKFSIPYLENAFIFLNELYGEYDSISLQLLQGELWFVAHRDIPYEGQVHTQTITLRQYFILTENINKTENV